ncbi:Uncharacterised protein [Segatella copri]|nr:Uncharacterised protein [Segatella copri]
MRNFIYFMAVNMEFMKKGILSLKVSITILLMIRLKEWRFQISLSRKSNLCLCI